MIFQLTDELAGEINRGKYRSCLAALEKFVWHHFKNVLKDIHSVCHYCRKVKGIPSVTILGLRSKGVTILGKSKGFTLSDSILRN